MELFVRSKTVEALDIVALELASVSGEPLPPFTAGAHIDLVLGNGLIRSYSLANDPAETDRYVVAVHRDPASRGGSAYVHDVVAVGDRIEVHGPRNNFELVENAPTVVLIAGGIGITPLWSMIQRLESLGRSWKLFYAVRSRSRCAYEKAIAALEASSPGRVHFHFNDEQGGALIDLPAILAALASDAHVYCCGPNPMLEAFEQATAGRNPCTVHLEWFRGHTPAATEGGYSVVLSRSGRTFRIPAGKSVLDVLIEAGLDIAYSCREGVCGACQTNVLEGEPDHRDSYLTPHEKRSGKTMLICCSGATGDRLVLDM